MLRSRAAPVPARMGGQIDDDGDVLVATAGVAPHMLVDADDLHVLEPVWVLDEDPTALG